MSKKTANEQVAFLKSKKRVMDHFQKERLPNPKIARKNLRNG